MEKITIQIKGMHCASCATNVERSLKKVKGVKNAAVNMLFGKAYVDSEGADKQELIKAVSKAGYKVTNIE